MVYHLFALSNSREKESCRRTLEGLFLPVRRDARLVTGEGCSSAVST